MYIAQETLTGSGKATARTKSIKPPSGVVRILTLLFLLPVFLLTGCGNGNGLKVGFEYGFSPNPIACAVKSEKTEFDIDDVTLDFYYGSPESAWGIGDGNYELVCFAVYFCNSKYLSTIEYLTTVIDDYRIIYGYFFVKEISPEEYASGDYDVENKMFSDKKFNHYETLTVPKEALELSKGYFGLTIMETYYSQKDDGYCVTHKGFGAVRYEKITDRTVRLSKPETTVFSDPV
ncbi:MAG: hypothetical protein LBS99_05880 [Clostridiales bacterium]|jgi:hypothetical protein|nr:hypothetical protein [Clostridiales bacterium]